MFFLGHMVWAYVWAVAFAGKSWGKLYVPVVLILGVMPDVDLLLRGFGVAHHTSMHSFFFWVVLFAPFLAVFRVKSVPYFVAVVQHFAFGDFFVGEVTLFWPFSRSYYGFDTAMVSVFDVALETAGLLLAAGIMYFNGDLKRLLSVNLLNILMFLPFSALTTSMLFFAVDWHSCKPLVTFVLSSPLFATIVSAHIALAVFLALSTAQGLRRFRACVLGLF